MQMMSTVASSPMNHNRLIYIWTPRRFARCLPVYLVNASPHSRSENYTWTQRESLFQGISDVSPRGVGERGESGELRPSGVGREENKRK